MAFRSSFVPNLFTLCNTQHAPLCACCFSSQRKMVKATGRAMCRWRMDRNNIEVETRRMSKMCGMLAQPIIGWLPLCSTSFSF